VLDVVFACGVVYLAMHLRSRRAAQALAEARKSERRFRDLTELSADWFWETDAAHRITWISGGTPVATFFGGIPTYGKRFWEIPGVQVESRVLESLHEGMEERRPFFDLEMTRVDERGARQIHIIAGQSRKDAAGRFLGYRGVGRDVTEQRRAERALAEAKERLELAVGAANLAEWDFDLESNAIYLGSGWAGLLGRRPVAGLMSGADVNELVHPDDRPAVRKEFVSGLKGEKTICQVDCRVRTEGAAGAGARDRAHERNIWASTARPGTVSDTRITSAPGRRSPSASSVSATWRRPPASTCGRRTRRGAIPSSRSGSRRSSATGPRSCSGAGRRTSCRSARTARCRSGSRTRRPTAMPSASSYTGSSPARAA
jgi:PAS domain-containing protein